MLRTVLLAEDNEDDVFFFKSTANRVGWLNPIAVAQDGREAIAALTAFARAAPEAQRIGLVLLDLKMPFVGGLEVLEWIRGQPELRFLPVCILSSSEQENDIEAAYRLGAASYLVKPTQPEGLSDLLRTIEGYWLKHNRLPAAFTDRHAARSVAVST